MGRHEMIFGRQGSKANISSSLDDDWPVDLKSSFQKYGPRHFSAQFLAGNL